MSKKGRIVIGAVALSCCLTDVAGAVACIGDCDGNGAVAIHELVTAVNIALGNRQLEDCGTCDGIVLVDCLVQAVNNALLGCPPDLALDVRVVAAADPPHAEVIGTISHRGGRPVSYRDGCTARCRPAFFEPVAFSVVGPDGEAVLIDDECEGPYLCPEGRQGLLPGEWRTTALEVAGTALARSEGYPGECFPDCPQRPLAPGRYVVTARFDYWLGLADTAGAERPPLTASVVFDWPPAP